MKEKNLSRSELKRSAIINAAMQEFQLKGFKTASMDDIAKRAEVSKRTVYNHFSSKDVLFSSIISEMFSMLCTFEPVPFSLEIPIETQLKQLAAHEISLLRKDGFITTAKVVIAEGIHSPHLLTDAMESFSNQETPLTSWFKAACAAGVLKTEHPELVATQFIAVIKAFCFWPQVTQCIEFPDDTTIALGSDTAVQMILKQYT